MRFYSMGRLLINWKGKEYPMFIPEGFTVHWITSGWMIYRKGVYHSKIDGNTHPGLVEKHLAEQSKN